MGASRVGLIRGWGVAGRSRDSDTVGQAAGVIRGEVEPREGRGSGFRQGYNTRPFGQIFQGPCL